MQRLRTFHPTSSCAYYATSTHAYPFAYSNSPPIRPIPSHSYTLIMLNNTPNNGMHMCSHRCNTVESIPAPSEWQPNRRTGRVEFALRHQSNQLSQQPINSNNSNHRYVHRQTRQHHQQQRRQFHSSNRPPSASTSASTPSSSSVSSGDSPLSFRHRESKRRKLPSWLASEELGQQHATPTGWWNNKTVSMNNNNPRQSQSNQLHRSPSEPVGSFQLQQQTETLDFDASYVEATSTSTPTLSANVWSRSQSVPVNQTQSSQSTHLRVDYLPAPPKCQLPTGFSVSYAYTRQQSDILARDLLQYLRAEMDHRAAPSTSQHSPSQSTQLCSCPIVIGFDLEWRPNFIKGQSQNPVALLQLSTPHHAYLFQLIRWCRPPNIRSGQSNQRQAEAAEALGPQLAEILLDENILKVGIGIKADVTKFLTDYGIRVGGMLDLSDYANERLDTSNASNANPNNDNKNNNNNPSAQPASASSSFSSSSSSSSPSPSVTVPGRNWSLAALVSETLRMELSKPKRVRMSNWENDLTHAQQQYAALDAYVSYAIFEQLHSHHQQHRNCVRALDIGRGKVKRSPPKESVIPVEVVVRGSVKEVAAVTKRSETIDLTGDSNSPTPNRTKRERSTSIHVIAE